MKALESKHALKQLSQAPAKGRRATREEAHTPEQRHRMIAEAAYYRAQQRGFDGGDMLRDWLDAEAEIDQVLPQAATH
ncbi:MAG: DUF2934 domain-containing protein [Betaproteobacteria bacterium]|nr:DUF2934 domain-containing protein [Betaproteobacteria bacterium]